MITPAVFLAVVKFNLLRRPLMVSTTAQHCLDVDRKKLNHMVDNGELAWAWNLGLGQDRNDLRILTACVVEHCMGPIKEIGATKNLKLPEVLGLILPQKRETVRGTELQRLFYCHANLIHHLNAVGEITRINEKLARVGPNASPRFTVDSVAAFLGKRRVF
jgi:hypothetical protein